MILTDKDIIDACDTAKPLIVPINELNLTPNGYDLSVGDTLLPYECKNHVLSIRPKTNFSILTMETINMPNNIVASLYLKSRYANQGIMATFGKVDAGFSGKLRLGMYNSSNEYVSLVKDIDDTRIAQIVFEELTGTPEKLYTERSGNYQNIQSFEDLNAERR